MNAVVRIAVAFAGCAVLAGAQQTLVVDGNPLGFEVEGLALDPQSGTLYGSTRTNELITIDPVTGAGSVIGSLGSTSVEGLAFDPQSGMLYGSDVLNGVLMTIDPLTAAGSVVGPFLSDPPTGLAYDPSTRTLFGADATNDILLTIDVTTGVVTGIGAFGPGLGSVAGLAFDTTAGKLYGVESDSNGRLFEIDPATGAGTPFGGFFFLELYGLAFDPIADRLIASTFDPNVATEPTAAISIDPVSAAFAPIVPPSTFIGLQDAVDAAQPGDEIHVMPGDYEGADVAEPLRIAGSGSDASSPTKTTCGALSVSNLLPGERVVVSGLCTTGATVDQCAGAVLFQDVEATGFFADVETLLVRDSDDVRFHRSVVVGGGTFGAHGPQGILCDSGARLELVECEVYGGSGFAVSGGGPFAAGHALEALTGSETYVALTDAQGGFGIDDFSSGGTGLRVQTGASMTVSGTIGSALVEGGIGGFGGSDGASMNVSPGGLLRWSGVAVPDGIIGPATLASPADPTLSVSGVHFPGATLTLTLHGPPGSTATLLVGSDPIVQATAGVLVDELVAPLDTVPLGTIPPSGSLTATYVVPDPVFGPDLIAQVELTDGAGLVSRTNSTMATSCGPLIVDCNQNGVPDACDVAVSDCNANGIPDDCDIAGGGDANGNGVLDECEQTVTYCTAKTNSEGCAPAVTHSGTASLTSPTAFVLSAPRVVTSVNGQFFYGLAGPASAPFLGGTLCAVPPLRRTTLQNSGGVPPLPCDGTLSFDFNDWIQGGNEPFLQLGLQVNGQFWYRDPGDSLGVGLTNAVEFFVGP